MTDLTIQEIRDAGIGPPPPARPTGPRARRRMRPGVKTFGEVRRALGALQDRVDELGASVATLAEAVQVLMRSHPTEIALTEGAGVVLDEAGYAIVLEPSTPAPVINGDLILVEGGGHLLQEDGYAILLEGENSPDFTGSAVTSDGDGGAGYEELVGDVADTWGPPVSSGGEGGGNSHIT